VLGTLFQNAQCPKEFITCYRTIVLALRRKLLLEGETMGEGEGQHDHGCVCDLLLMRGWSQSVHPGKHVLLLLLFCLGCSAYASSKQYAKIGQQCRWAVCMYGADIVRQQTKLLQHMMLMPASMHEYNHISLISAWRLYPCE